jgi:uncharacterized protein YjiS (DUF1127 family)
MTSLGASEILSRDYGSHCISLRALLAEWWERIRSRYQLENLSDRDLADMGLTRLDVFNEAQKAFWQE